MKEMKRIKYFTKAPEQQPLENSKGEKPKGRIESLTRYWFKLWGEGSTNFAKQVGHGDGLQPKEPIPFPEQKLTTLTREVQSYDNPTKTKPSDLSAESVLSNLPSLKDMLHFATLAAFYMLATGADAAVLPEQNFRELPHNTTSVETWGSSRDITGETLTQAFSTFITKPERQSPDLTATGLVKRTEYATSYETVPLTTIVNPGPQTGTSETGPGTTITTDITVSLPPGVTPPGTMPTETSSTSNGQEGTGGGGLSVGAIVGIGIGSGFGLGAIVAALWYYRDRRRQQREIAGHRRQQRETTRRVEGYLAGMEAAGITSQQQAASYPMEPVSRIPQ